MTAKTNKAKTAAPVSKAAKRAPGNAKALQQKAADNVAKLRKQAGRVECIKSTVALASGGIGICVTTSRDRSIVIQRIDKEVNRLSKVGEPVAALEAYLKTQPKPQARLAAGVDSHNSPHSAKAAADQRKGAKPATGKAGKARTEKAAKAKQPSRGTSRAYKLGDRKDESKPDTFRRYMLSTIMAHKTTDAAKAAHAKSGKYPTHKLDFNWSAQQGYIKFVD